MAPQRNADAANISPYPFVVHQVPSPPQDNGDRASRPSRAKKRLRQRQERADARQGQEEERRFNLGVRRTGNHAPRRVFPPPGRAVPNGVPDYPPPTFEETVNSPSMSVCSSTVSLVSTLPNPPLAIPEPIPEDSIQDHSTESSRSRRVEIDPISEASGSDHASESDESVVIINKNEIPVSSTDLPRGRDLEAKVKKDWLKRRGVDFPTTSTSDILKHSDSNPRGRKPARPTLLIDPAVANGPFLTPASPISSPKRRFLSLSPIRTIIPLKSVIQEDRAHSAHPSPVSTPPSSPYAGSKSFFRSTTSLATVSFLRLPGVSSSSHSKKDSLSRRLFSFKGKAKEAEVEHNDESWEVVSGKGEDDSSTKKEEHPASLMSLVESMSMNGSVVTLSKTSPTRSTFSVQSSPNRLQSTLTSPSVVSLRDKSPVTPFIERSVNRRSINLSPTIHEAPETPTTTTLQTPTTTNPSTPPRTPTRSTELPPSPSPPAARRATQPPPPLRMETRPNLKQSIAPVAQQDIDQPLSEEPLPMTPVYHKHFEVNAPPTIQALKEQIRAPVAIHAPYPSQSGENALGAEESTHTPPPADQGCVCGGSPHSRGKAPAHGSSPLPNSSVYPHHPSGLPTQTQVSLLLRPSLNDEPMTPTKLRYQNHFTGRPLPRPPPGSNPNTPPPASVVFNRSNAPVDSMYSSPSMEDRYSPTDSNYGFPEGQLIDLEDHTLDSCISPTTTEASTGSSLSRNSARSSQDRRYRSEVHLPTLTSGKPPSMDASADRGALGTPELSELSFGSSAIQASSTPAGPYGRPSLPQFYSQPNAYASSGELSRQKPHYAQQQQHQHQRQQQQQHLHTLQQPKWGIRREYSQATDPSDMYGSEVGYDRDESVIDVEEEDEEVVYYPSRRRGSATLHDADSNSSFYPAQRRPSHDTSFSRDNATWIRDPVGLNSRGNFSGSTVLSTISPPGREVPLPAGSGSAYGLPSHQPQYHGVPLDSSLRQRQNTAPWAY